MPHPNEKDAGWIVTKDKFSRQRLILYACGILPVIWLALLVAPAFGDGLPGFLSKASVVFEHPLQITICEDSLKTVLVFVLCYVLILAVILSDDKNYRRREEHGSAKWGSPNAVNKKYAGKQFDENKVLTQNVAIGLDGRTHRRNLNVLVCGGSGAGKTRFYAKPNIMNANTSFVVLDPKGYNLGG